MKIQQQRGFFAIVIALALLAWASAAVGQNHSRDHSQDNGQDENQNKSQNLTIGVVDLARLVSDSPQAVRAKTNMARQFAGRKNQIESKTNALRQDMDRLQQDGSVMSEVERQKLQAGVRDRQRSLQMQQSKYNDDVSAAEQKELEQMRSAIRAVIDQYAADHGYDLILGDSVLYAADAVDVTEDVLALLKKRE